MFSHLSIRNYVLIQELEIAFHPGLSIITGETGAGKSILLGALGLLTGQRADSSALLDSSKKCIVEGTFRLQDISWKEYFEKQELEYDPETIIRREISFDGKSRAFINDSPVNLSLLKELGSKIIDIHSQHHNIYLQSPDFQLQILDTYAQQRDIVADFSKEYTRYRNLSSELEALRETARQQQAELDYHRFRFEELQAARLREGEQEELENELKTLTHAEEIKSSFARIYSLLDADEASVSMMLKSVTSLLSRIGTVYPSADNLLRRTESSLIELKDIAAEAERITGEIYLDPARMDEVNARLDLFYSLLRKHKVSSLKELIGIRDGLDAKIAEITDYDVRIEQLEDRVSQLREQLSVKSSEISAGRQSAIQAIEKRVHHLLLQLGIPNALFRIELTPAEQLISTGSDLVKFLFSANRQQNIQELAKVASGGEISRLMLSIKAAISEKVALPTLIFDEIDSGVSGEIAGKMGSILEQMASYAQIVNITHLPQIAAKGVHHYKVYKEDREGLTQSNVKELTPEERIIEIAKMLSNEKVTDAAIANARHLLGKE